MAGRESPIVVERHALGTDMGAAGMVFRRRRPVVGTCLQLGELHLYGAVYGAALRESLAGLRDIAPAAPVSTCPLWKGV